MNDSAHKRGFWFYLRRSALGFLGLVVLLAMSGAIYQAIATVRDARALHVPGRRVDLGGYSLHLYCAGLDQPDDLTVILESGLGTTTSGWARIQDQLSADARVCSYDRGGIGWSDPTPRPRDSDSIAAELHELLDRAGIRGELVLVGHSLGGIYVRSFRARYPERVAGMVLLESSSERQFSSTPTGVTYYRRIRQAYSILPLAARLGLARVTPACDLPEDFPSAARADYHARCSRTDSWQAQRREIEAVGGNLAGVPQSLRDLPLLVITAGNDPLNLPDWAELQNELAALSSRSQHIVRANATHPGLLTNAEDARQCALAIADLLKSLRERQAKS